MQQDHLAVVEELSNRNSRLRTQLDLVQLHLMETKHVQAKSKATAATVVLGQLWAALCPTKSDRWSVHAERSFSKSRPEGNKQKTGHWHKSGGLRLST